MVRPLQKLFPLEINDRESEEMVGEAPGKMAGETPGMMAGEVSWKMGGKESESLEG